MSTRNSADLEEIVRRTLSSQAGAAPSVGEGIAERAIHRGRVVRRRRRVVGAVAGAAASLAVVGTVWGVFGQQHEAATMPAGQPATTQPVATSGPAAVVPRGDLTSSGVVLRLPGRDVALDPSIRSVRRVERAGESFVALVSTAPSAAAGGSGQSLLVVAPGAQPRVLATGAVLDVAVSPDAKRVAYVGGPAGAAQTLPKVRDLATGQLLASAETDPITSVADLAWDGEDVLVTTADGARSVHRWTPGGGYSAVDGMVAAAPVAGGKPLVVVASGDRQCLRRSGSDADILCGGRVEAGASPDGTLALAHVTDNGAESLYRVDVAASTAKKLGGKAVAGARWNDLAWTTKDVPLVPTGEAWRSVDLATGATAPQALPAGATRSITW